MNPGVRPVGRFAPSPTGSLHLGSLVTALSSWLDIRQQGGLWRLRIDDIDPPREVAGASSTIIGQLAQHGLEWDGDVIFQSERHDRYHQAIASLLHQGTAFYCTLSRQQIAALGGCHPGLLAATDTAQGSAVRIVSPTHSITFDDRVMGAQHQDISHEGAFVIKRRDGYFAYQLACALDDAELGMTHVLRGQDLLESTFRQIHILESLGLKPPDYGHLPLLLDVKGAKLSKSAGSAALHHDPATNLLRCYHLLGMPPTPQDIDTTNVGELLTWGLAKWHISKLPKGHICAMRS